MGKNRGVYQKFTTPLKHVFVLKIHVYSSRKFVKVLTNSLHINLLSALLIIT